ncbi:MAG: AAA family ATPase [Caulobacteraceae bacterium]|nr:AAA family ATPase [Caulobacteraceae bacterium]
MIEQPVTFLLPKPWEGVHFRRDRIGAINFLVGPNGSGKSRFADSLRQALPGARLLGTDRLSGMGANSGFGLWGDNLAAGYQKGHFQHFKSAGSNYGSGVDTYILLEERPDIRIMVEATLSSLFNRNIQIEWDSGNLVPKAVSGKTGDSYRVDRDECHGIRELLVLLSHLYNDENKYLIIDEPELNLHPQYQSFLMQEIRAVAGDPNAGGRKKGVFLITHSPFMIDLRGMEDLASVLSFSSHHTAPVSIGGVEGRAAERLTSLVPRLNVHHKQLFFSDNPIFVEGILDAQIIEAIQERRRVSITAAGSCIIDVGGCEEVNKYLELCRALSKSAFFLYDLDSLFLGNLRQCIRADGEVAEFLSALGLGRDFGDYCGELDRKLTDAVKAVTSSQPGDEALEELKSYIKSVEEDGKLVNKGLARARVAVLTDLSARRNVIAPVIGEALALEIEGRRNRIVEILRTKNVFLLPGGALEHYLPSYNGHRYSMNDSVKRKAVEDEVVALSSGQYDDSRDRRYGALFESIAYLPAKAPVDTDAVLLSYLSDYVHQLQGLVVTHAEWTGDHLNGHFLASANGLGKFFEVIDFKRAGRDEFAATIRVRGIDQRIVKVTHETNAGMRRFMLETVATPATA